MSSIRSADGTDVRIFDEGHGSGILILGPGSDDGTAWSRVTRVLAERYRVIRLVRRPYRTDLAVSGGYPIAREVEDALAVVGSMKGPWLLVGHSSGGVVGLEALAASPGEFVGSVLYEPAVTIPGEPWDQPLGKAIEALDAGRPGEAMRVFAADIVKIPGWQARLGGILVSLIPRYRATAAGQICDAKAIHELGLRLDAYRGIQTPVLLLSGSRSPVNLAERIDALLDVMPNAEKIVLQGQGHTANLKTPGQLAKIIERYAADHGLGPAE